MGPESLFATCTRTLAITRKTCKDHPLPHDRSLPMTSVLFDEACAALHYAAYTAWAQAPLQRAEEEDDLEIVRALRW